MGGTGDLDLQVQVPKPDVPPLCSVRLGSTGEVEAYLRLSARLHPLTL